MRAAQNPFQAWPAYSDITADSILKDFHISAFQCCKSAIEFEKAHRTWMSSFMRATMGRQTTKKDDDVGAYACDNIDNYGKDHNALNCVAEL